MRFLEMILGLEKGYLSSEGDWRLEFMPTWPGQQWLDEVFRQAGWGATLWNLLLGGLALALVLYVYWREGRSRPVRIGLGVLRGLLLAFVLALLNQPVLTLYQSRTEPSVLAVMMDRSISMRVRDAGAEGQPPLPRMEAVQQLLLAEDQALLRELSRKHTLRFYEFDGTARPMATIGQGSDLSALRSEDQDEGDSPGPARVVQAIEQVRPEGQHTQVVGSIQSVLDDLQGQRVAGVVVLTDGRDTPQRSSLAALEAVKGYGVKLYPIPVGSDQAPRNIVLQGINVQESAFQGDIVNVKATVRATGYPAGHPVRLVLKDKRTGQPLLGEDGSAVAVTVQAQPDAPQEVELQFLPAEIGPLDVVVEAERQDGELDEEDNEQWAAIEVLDAKLTVLYVDGSPRWEYRYLVREMTREKTVNISSLLTSADPSFAQEGDKPIKRFPEAMEELIEYDVVVFGDVDPRQFGEHQLQLVAEFVSRKGGGFGMIAGPRWSPRAWRDTAIEPLLPVNTARVETTDPGATITQGFRPVLTREGAASSVFRFFADRQRNERYLKEEIQPVFWYCRGITVKQGVGEVYAEHPVESGPDGRKAPILVFGRFGSGRTMFSAIDDSWRWRYYTGESVFDTYWVQQLRHLAREKKLGQRKLTFTSVRPVYALNEQVEIAMRALDPQLQQQLPESVSVDIVDEQGDVVRRETLMRQEAQRELYNVSFTADRVGQFTARLPGLGGTEALELPIRVIVPREELARPEVDRTQLTRLASETLGQTIELGEARQKLPTIASAAKVIPVRTSEPLWDAPLALLIFVLLITSEWVLRKVFGML